MSAVDLLGGDTRLDRRVGHATSLATPTLLLVERRPASSVIWAENHTPNRRLFRSSDAQHHSQHQTHPRLPPPLRTSRLRSGFFAPRHVPNRCAVVDRGQATHWGREAVAGRHVLAKKRRPPGICAPMHHSRTGAATIASTSSAPPAGTRLLRFSSPTFIGFGRHPCSSPTFASRTSWWPFSQALKSHTTPFPTVRSPILPSTLTSRCGLVGSAAVIAVPRLPHGLYAHHRANASALYAHLLPIICPTRHCRPGAEAECESQQGT